MEKTQKYSGYKFKITVAIILIITILFTHVCQAAIISIIIFGAVIVGGYWALTHVIDDTALGNYLEGQLASLFLRAGDKLLNMMSEVVEQEVSIDGIIFNKIEKINIDFWGVPKSSDSETSFSGMNVKESSIAATMSNTINYWYNVFRNIATVVYLIVLIYVAIKILLSSTGSGRARYINYIKDWVIGVAILFLFPYVMKYTIQLNHALVEEVAKIGTGASMDLANGQNLLSETDEALAQNPYTEEAKNSAGVQTIIDAGTKHFVNYLGEEGLMGKTRKIIDEGNARITLIIIYYIFIFQTLALLIMYYKRVFMTGFLIVIFPLVAMTYTVDRLRRQKITIIYNMV